MDIIEEVAQELAKIPKAYVGITDPAWHEKRLVAGRVQAKQLRQIFIKHLREVVEGAKLTDEEIKEKLGEIQPEGFDWVNITEAEMYKFRAVDQLQLQAILNLKALEEK